ncbi:MAG TPA: hypothetical protein VF734_12625 [Pseudonocardiaceae bacterium]
MTGPSGCCGAGTVEEERHLADTLAALPRVAADLGTNPDVVDRLRREYETHLRILRVSRNGADNTLDIGDEPVLRHEQQYAALRLALLGRKRATVLRLRDERRTDDTVLRQVQARLDIEEVRLSQHEAVD